MQIPMSDENNEWWKSGVTKKIDKLGNRQPIQNYDISQIFSIMMGINDDSAPPELPQVEFSILQNWMQIAVVLTQQTGDHVIKNYSAVIAYNGIMTEEKRRELYQFLTDYFLEEHTVFSLVIQQPQQIARS